MQYRKMPKIDIPLSILGFGCMRLPLTPDGEIHEERAISQIRAAIDQGVNYLDTAWPYHGGKSEALVARALDDGYRDKAFVATKLPSWMIRDRAHMDQIFEAQCRTLGSIDFYLIHNLNGPMWERMKSLGVLDFLDSIKAQGRTRYLGFSFHGHIEDFKTIIDDYDWEFCQIQYNFLDEDHQAGTRGLEYAAAKDLGVIIMEPLRGGSLGRPLPPPAVAKIWEGTQRSPVDWALSWVWDRPEVTLVLSGMNQEAHIEENIRIAQAARPLTPEEKDRVSRVAQTYKDLMKVGCTGCEYCLPCPMGVNIPAALGCWNHYHLYDRDEGAKFTYAMRCGGIFNAGDEQFASRCVACGECLDKCPQGISIPHMLEKAAADLEDEFLQDRLAAGKKRLNME